jgi:hypothetical protein
MMAGGRKVHMTLVKIDASRIRDWDTFHDEFAKVLGFPSFYGRNLNAWVDCMTYLDEPETGMTTIHAPKGSVLVLQIDHVTDFAIRCPDVYAALVECAGFVNWRRIQMGQAAVLALSFYKHEQSN